MARARKPGKRRRRVPLLGWLVLLAFVAAAGWFAWLYRQIDQVGRVDDAHFADAIAVFGAAQYVGHPSPVFHARLDHAVSLFERQIAPLVIVLGGSSDDRSTQTEGSVGRDYLLARGVPYDHILAETESVDTEQQAQRLADIARQRDLRSVVVVSDPSHLFRIAELCREQGLTVHTSPRPTFGTISPLNRRKRVLHEMLSYTALRFHLQASFLHRWLEGREEL
ncbi:YdcF family protein [Terriglobus sp.]|uniref:YdcF family protein n=1 Tax=Terriglobus sp. TaxID=1889013 RepID=UPI003B0000CC